MGLQDLTDNNRDSINKHWRNVAEFDRYVEPLIVRLQAVDWPTVLALHSARWHREALHEIRSRTGKYTHYCSLALSHQQLTKDSQSHKPIVYDWIGGYFNIHSNKHRQIQRYPLIYIHNTGSYPVHFCPIEGQPVSHGFWFRVGDFNRRWKPESRALQQYQFQKNFVANWLKTREIEQRNGPNRRQYLADCLQSISIQLGSYVRSHYGNANGFFYEDKFELSYDLINSLSINTKKGVDYNFGPSNLGEAEAKVQHFWNCLGDFLEAEKPTPNKEAIPQSVAVVDDALLLDVQRHFPGILVGPFVPYPPEMVIPSIACHLGERWAAPRQLSAPSDYDEAYYNQSPAARLEFLAALRRVYNACSLALEADFTGSELFATLIWKESKEAPNYTKEQLWCLTRRGAAWLGSWLNWRELPPTEQLLAALSTVQIANADLGITTEEAKRPPRLFVPDCAPEIEAARFRMLLKEFQRALPSKLGKLRPLLARLATLKALPIAALREGPTCELPARFPDLHWLGLEKRAPNSLEAKTFWPDLAQTLLTRADWAARAYDVVANALGEMPTTTATGIPATPVPDVSARATEYAWDEIDRLAELIELRKAGAFTPANNRVKAAVAGFIDALREAELVPTTNTLPQLYAAFGAHYGREVGADRINDTRTNWQRKARKALGLDS